MHNPRLTVGIVLVLWCALARADAEAAAADVNDGQRRDYQAALAAVRANDIARFKALYDKLDGYVLRGYLQYEYLKDRLDGTPAATLKRFLEENAHTPLAEMLRAKWLHRLAARGDWKTFMAEYADIADEPELLCLQLGRRLRTDEPQAGLMARIDRLWSSGRRLPGACEPVFAAWRKAGHMTADKVWERIRLAMEARNVSLAGELAVHLAPKDRAWVQRWQAMYRDPVRELEAINYPVDTPVARMIVRHGIVRLAYRDPEEAMRRWRALKEEHEFFGEDENYVLRHVGILAAQRHLPVALEWLSAVSAQPDDRSLQLWRITAALRSGQWETAQRFIAALPAEEGRSPRWRYWSARVHEEKGEKRKARMLYTGLAPERDYYGFLAADRIGAEYSMQHESVATTPEERAAMLARPGLRAAGELYALGQIAEARRQWGWTIGAMNNRELQIAAVVARDWGWHDRAIYTLALSDHPHDLELRFPVLYRELIEATASEYAIDPGWVYGVVRQESAFVADARSEAGALGLMQLMPATGRLTGRKLKLPVRNHQALLKIETNVRLGVSYLKDVLERNKGHQVLATAAYNAGPNRVSEWMPPQPLDADVWVETIPYSETRGYVQNVLAYTAVYDYRLGQTPTRLSARMPAVAAPP